MASLAELLSRHPAHLWVGARRGSVGPRLATGHAGLDAALDGGWPTGTLIELLAEEPGLGRCALLLPMLAALTRQGRHVAWLPAEDVPHAPALVQAGVDLGCVLVMDVAEPKQRLWAAERCLQSGSCAALVMQESRRVADPWLRRLKLAAAANAATLFLLRPASAAATPSPATLRLHIGANPYSRIRRISLLKGAGPSARTLELDLHAAGH
jgi:hypothetical protein